MLQNETIISKFLTGHKEGQDRFLDPEIFL